MIIYIVNHNNMVPPKALLILKAVSQQYNCCAQILKAKASRSAFFKMAVTARQHHPVSFLLSLRRNNYHIYLDILCSHLIITYTNFHVTAVL